MKYLRQVNHPVFLKPSHPTLQYFKILPEAFEPEWGTDHSACFDLRACLPNGTTVKLFTVRNEPQEYQIGFGWKLGDEPSDVVGPESMTIRPGDRVLVPTGLILDIPFGYSVRLHSRSGLALKQGLVLANHEGVVDSDYVHPTFVLLTNTGRMDQQIMHGDRLAQAEMIVDIAYDILETSDQPQQKSNRVGGLGSTGVK